MKKLLYVVTALAAQGAAWVHAAIPVEGITAEKVGIPAEDFVTPEAAKAVAVWYFNKHFNRSYPVGSGNTVVLPWIIESWNQYKPPTVMAYYEITVFSGYKTFDTMEGLDVTVKAYVDAYINRATVVNDELLLPYALLSREDLTQELFDDSDVMTCWVPLNKAGKTRIYRCFDVAIGFDFLIPHIGKKVLTNLYGFETVDYEKTVWFGFPDAFSIFQVGGGRRVYIQTSDKENKYRIFTNEADFDKYYEANKGTINLKSIERNWEEE